MKKMTFIFLVAFPMTTFGNPQQLRDELAKANSSCVGFYSAIQSIVKPEAKPEYLKKYGVHLRFVEVLQKNLVLRDNQLRVDISDQNDLLAQASSNNKRVEYFRNGLISCNSIESHTPLIIQEHRLD